MQSVTELLCTHINVVKSKGILKAPSNFGSRHTTTTDHSLDLGGDFKEGGKLKNTEKNPRSTGDTNYNNSILTRVPSFFENHHGAIPRLACPIKLWIYNRSDFFSKLVSLSSVLYINRTITFTVIQWYVIYSFWNKNVKRINFRWIRITLCERVLSIEQIRFI